MLLRIAAEWRGLLSQDERLCCYDNASLLAALTSPTRSSEPSEISSFIV